MIEKEISTEIIKLDSFLKYVGFCDSGSSAKEKILQGKIKVNDEVCYQRGRKLKDKDVIEILGGQKYKVKVIGNKEDIT